MAKSMSTADKQDIFAQLDYIVRPSVIVDAAIDTKRMVAYAAVEYHTDNNSSYLPDGMIFGLVASIYDADERGEGYLGYNFVVTSDEMPSESMGISDMEYYCHCPIRILKKLSKPNYRDTESNEWAMEWREICAHNARRKK